MKVEGQKFIWEYLKKKKILTREHLNKHLIFFRECSVFASFSLEVNLLHFMFTAFLSSALNAPIKGRDLWT